MEAISSSQCLDLTPAAVAEANRLLAAENNPNNNSLRIYVEKGGCSGMQYGLVFDEQRDGDQVMHWDALPVVVESISAEYLKGPRVDFADDLNDSGFKVTNSKAKATCG